MEVALFCRVCGDRVSDSRQRRRLSGCSVVPTTVELLTESAGGKLTNSGALSVLVSTDSKSQEAYICKKCLGDLEKFRKVKAQFQQLHDSLLQRLEWHHRTLPQSSQSTATTTETSRCQLGKRSQEVLEQSLSSSLTVPAVKRAPVPEVLVREDSPPIEVRIGYRSGTKPYCVRKAMRPYVKAAARGNLGAIARGIGRDKLALPVIMKELQRLINKELRVLCSDSFNSILREKSPAAFQAFTWDSLWLELVARAPVFLAFAKGCAPRRRGDKEVSERAKPVLCMCAAMLLKLRNPKMSLVQNVVSLLLQAGHCGNQVFVRLQKLMVCMSPRTTVNILDSLGEGHDEPVEQWRDSLLSRVEKPLQVSATIGSELHVIVSGLENISIIQSDGASMIDELDASGRFEPVRTSSPIDHPFLDAESPVSSPTPPNYSSLSTIPDMETSCLVDVRTNLESVRLNFTSSEQELQSSLPDQSLETPVVPPGMQPCVTQASGLSCAVATCSVPEPPAPEAAVAQDPDWCGFKLVGDNLDKHMKPRYQRVDMQTQSLHYFQVFAVKDRVNLSHLPDYFDKKRPAIEAFPVESLLPTESDLQELLQDITTLVARDLAAHLPAFASFAPLTVEHIKHRYWKEMSRQSQVVPLGVYLKDENKLDEMVDAMRLLHEYVPTLTTKETMEIPDEEVFEVEVDHFHHILFGGDQLTVARGRGAQQIRANSETKTEQLRGLVPVVEDWHARVTLMSAIWKRLYRASSSQEGGTLFQLKNLINRTNLPTEPKNNVNAVEDFLTVVRVGHTVAAAIEFFHLECMKDANVPKRNLPCGFDTMSIDDKRKAYHNMVLEFVRTYVNLSIIKPPPSSASNDTSKPKTRKSAKRTPPNPGSDGVREYAREVLSLTLLEHEFHDATKEGDGERVLRVWKFLLLLFKASGNRNYAIEAPCHPTTTTSTAANVESIC